MSGSGIFSETADGTLRPGTLLGKYQVVRMLGAGGMGAVYEAIHTEIGKHVALKVLSPAIAAIPGARGRFLREAQLTSRVQHPNIVNVTDTGSEGDQTFLVMELFRGEDLAQRIARMGRLSAQECVDIMLPVCSAVVAAHEVGVTHRDLKPSNIFLSESQHGIDPKILDFGISKSMDAGLGPEALTGTGTVVGTPHYLAPEQVMDNRSAGPASDQYTLGVILYECLTGVRPFQSDSLYVVFRDIVAGAPLSPRSICSDIPVSLEQIVLRAMSVTPTARFDSARDLGGALLPFASTRMKSIWEHAFIADNSRDSGFGVPPGLAVQSGRAVANTRILTPAADGPPVKRPASGPIGLAGGTQIATPISASWLRGGKPPQSEVIEAPFSLEDTDLRPRRRWLPFTMVALFVVVAFAGWLALKDSAVLSSSSSENRKKPKKALNLAEETDDVAAPGLSNAANSTTGHRDTETFDVSVAVEPDAALIELDGRPVGRGRLARTLSKDHVLHHLRITADGYGPELVEFNDTAPPNRIVLTRTISPGEAREGVERDGVQRARPGRNDSDRPRRHNRSRGQRQNVDTDTEKSGPTMNPNGAPVID